MAAAYENIQTETKGRVGIIRLNRPKALNALCADLVRELGLALDAFEADSGIGCMVLTGSDKESVFFKSRALSPSALFPGAKQAVGTEARPTFSAGDPGTWDEAHIMSLYGAAPAVVGPSTSHGDAPVEGVSAMQNAG